MAPAASAPPSDNSTVVSQQLLPTSTSTTTAIKMTATEDAAVGSAPPFGAVATDSETSSPPAGTSAPPTAADAKQDGSMASESPETESSDSSSAKKAFRCPFPGCGKEFQLKGNLKRHQNIHAGDKKFRCAFCGKDFLRKADMEVHHRVHTGEKPYHCKFAPECDKSFARRSDLLSHERTHIGTKPFACLYPGCGRHFARKFDLQKHQRMHGDHSSECQKRRKISSPSSDDCDCWSGSAPPTDEEQASSSASVAASSASTSPVVAAAGAEDAGRVAAAGAAPVTRYQLTCTQDHIHSPPACFAAFTSMESLDDSFLLSPHEAFDLKPYAAPSASSVGAAATAAADGGCCSGHEHASIKRQFAALEINGVSAMLGQQQHSHHLFPAVAAAAPAPAPPATAPPVFAFSVQQLPQHPTPSTAAAALVHRQRSTSSCPIDAELLKDYGKHTPSCGHLSIVHGDHRDYVVKNHLVCPDSVRSISGGDDHAAQPRKCAADEPHRPGCGHLAVRHRDHIDYVVEDNLFCQQEGLLGEVHEHIELLDDDFWDFYGAVGSLTND